MANIQQKKAALADVFANAAADALKKLESDGPVDDVKAAKLQKLNRSGGMLMAELTIAKRPGAPDPLCVTTNEEIRYIKRGKKVTVPWYVVQQMLNNIERVFYQEENETGKKITHWNEQPSEPITYHLIDPAEGVELSTPPYRSSKD